MSLWKELLPGYDARIERQDITGHWVPLGHVQNTGQAVALRLDEVQKFYGGQRVRAIDSSGRILDIR